MKSRGPLLCLVFVSTFQVMALQQTAQNSTGYENAVQFLPQATKSTNLSARTEQNYDRKRKWNWTNYIKFKNVDNVEKITSNKDLRQSPTEANELILLKLNKDVNTVIDDYKNILDRQLENSTNFNTNNKTQTVVNDKVNNRVEPFLTVSDFQSDNQLREFNFTRRAYNKKKHKYIDRTKMIYGSYANKKKSKIISTEELVRRYIEKRTYFRSHISNDFSWRRKHDVWKREAEEEVNIDELCKPFTTLTEEKMFYSPGYSNEEGITYPKNIDCIGLLEAEHGYLIQIDFRTSFHIEESENCTFDFLEIRDGEYGFARPLARLCGDRFPPRLVSTGRRLHLHFHSDDSIEHTGFSAIVSYIARPTGVGAPAELDPCVHELSGVEGEVARSGVDEVCERAAAADRQPLDAVWAIRVQEGWKIQLSFEKFSLAFPNDCESNFLDVFENTTDMSSRVKNFCGSIADGVTSKSSEMFVRFYAVHVATNSSFSAIFTAFRERKTSGSGTQPPCADDEFDCEDANCIALSLMCNKRPNCRYKGDESESICADKAVSVLQSEHIVIIVVIFSLILFGMSAAFVFKCIRKLMSDHKIIQEHIRQSREDKLDELSRAASSERSHTVRSARRTRQASLASLERATHNRENELLDACRALGREKSASSPSENGEMTSGSQTNLQVGWRDVSVGAPDTKESGCQTRESLFQTSAIPLTEPQPRTVIAMETPSSRESSAFSTFGYGGRNGGGGRYRAEARLQCQPVEQPTIPQDIVKKGQDKRPSSTSTTRSAPDVIIVGRQNM